MKKTFLVAVLALIFSIFVSAQKPYVVVLGIAQAAGIPQIGCDSPFCQKAWKDAKLRQMVSSIALVDPRSKERWIFDATPDLPAQFQLLKETTGNFSNSLTGIFLTHAHIGHYTGLMFLGRESLNAKGVKVYAMPRMKTLLETNAPWSQLVSLNNISLHTLENAKVVKLGKNLNVEPFLVPHRDEFSETVGYKISTNDKSLIFISDIDKWQKWSESLVDAVKTNDYLLLDGTFYADGEISRPMSEVPHPFVTETMELLKDLPANEKRKVFFIHFNHSNPLVQRNKRIIRELETNGFAAVFEGQRFQL